MEDMYTSFKSYFQGHDVQARNLIRKYVSLDYHYIVNDDNQRIEYFNKLAQCDKIIMVI